MVMSQAHLSLGKRVIPTHPFMCSTSTVERVHADRKQTRGGTNVSCSPAEGIYTNSCSARRNKALTARITPADQEDDYRQQHNHDRGSRIRMSGAEPCEEDGQCILSEAQTDI